MTKEIPENIKADLLAFIADVQFKIDKDHEEQGFHDFMKVNVEYSVGRKYIRIIRADTHKSVYCFCDFGGNLYKAAGWAGPAKGIRGTLKSVAERGGINAQEFYSFGDYIR